MCTSVIAGALLLVGNIALAVCGITLMTIGIMGLVSPNLIYDMLSSDGTTTASDLMDVTDVYIQSSSIMITFGGLILVVAILGACSSLCGGICRLIYTILLLAFIAGHVMAVIYLSSEGGHTDFRDQVESALKTKFKEYTDNPEKVDNLGNIKVPSNTTTGSWFHYQSTKSCCGIKSYDNFNGKVTPSCCHLINEKAGAATNINQYSDYTECTKLNSTSYLHIEGCLDNVVLELSAGPQLGIMLCTISLLCMACCLALVIHLMS